MLFGCQHSTENIVILDITIIGPKSRRSQAALTKPLSAAQNAWIGAHNMQDHHNQNDREDYIAETPCHKNRQSDQWNLSHEQRSSDLLLKIISRRCECPNGAQDSHTVQVGPLS